MGSYISNTEAENFMGSRAFIQCLDDDNDGTADSDIITQVMAMTDNDVSTLSVTSARKVTAAYDIFRYYANYRRNTHGAYEARYNYWMTFQMATLTGRPCWNPEEQPNDESDGWFDHKTDDVSE